MDASGLAQLAVRSFQRAQSNSVRRHQATCFTNPWGPSAQVHLLARQITVPHAQITLLPAGARLKEPRRVRPVEVALCPQDYWDWLSCMNCDLKCGTALSASSTSVPSLEDLSEAHALRV